MNDKSYNTLCNLYYIKNINMKQLKATVPCYFCKRYFTCYYSNELCYQGYVDKYRYYVCHDLHEDLIGLPEKMTLIHHITINLNEDMKNVIFSYFCDIISIPSCIISKNKIIINRNNYIDYDYTSLTIKQLKELMIQRNLPVIKNKLKKYYLEQINYDVITKKFEWQ
jgi:hypothetical protein